MSITDRQGFSLALMYSSFRNSSMSVLRTTRKSVVMISVLL